MKIYPFCISLFKRHANKASLLFIILLVTGCLSSFSLFKGKPKQNIERIRMLENIESIMFLDPENLDSLVNSIDTTNMSLLEQGRLSSIRAKMYRDKKDYINSIAALEKADSIFLVCKDPFHQNINKYIKATVFEFMQLNSAAAELFVESNLFFDQNQNHKFKFYTSLGILRLKDVLKIDSIKIICDLEKDVSNFNDPLFTGLLYSTLGHICDNDTLSQHYFSLATAEYRKVQAWSRMYDAELNILNIKIKSKSLQNAEKDYYNFCIKDYHYTPNSDQKLRYRFYEGYLFTWQRDYSKAIKVTNEVLIKSRDLFLTSSEIACLSLLNFLYFQVGDYKNAYIMLEEYNNLRRTEMNSLEQVRLLALGSHYRYTKLENERLRLSSRIRINKLIFGLILLTLLSGLFFTLNRLKQGKLQEKILKLSNIEIKEQIINLHRSFEKTEGINSELISIVEELESKYRESRELAAFSHKADNNSIKSWLDFEHFLSEKHPGLIEALKKNGYELSPTEIKYCMCFCYNLNNYEISKLLKVGENAVKSAKRRIRIKLALNHSKEIYTFLKSFTK
jgi:DNA-binding CsgD family transcriptional regulator